MLRRLQIGWKAARQLGFEQVSLYALYKAGLRIDLWKNMTPAKQEPVGVNEDYGFSSSLIQPDPADYRTFFQSYPEAAAEILQEADEILSGKVRLFGGPPLPLILSPPDARLPWTLVETHPGRVNAQEDIKFTWEPARFGWAVVLARAYLLNGSNDYAKFFWEKFEEFQENNPPYLGPNWSSGQEAALRLIAWVFAWNVFRSSPQTTPERSVRLVRSLAQHAERIPPTLLYARSQNNNHLISEALGLYTAGSLLPRHPNAGQWKTMGWKWLNTAFQKQIAADGTYVQHSANYHRLMLQAALWADWIARSQGDHLPAATTEKLASAAHWMLAQLDFSSGQFPNLGSNDGAYILPLAQGGFADYRPTAQAAARVFLNQSVFEHGTWDEMCWWFLPGSEDQSFSPEISPAPPHTTGSPENQPLMLRGSSSWASMRAVQYQSRPAHADQLHVELWWQGFNIARDAGTYRYTAPAPWNNTLAQTGVHNTITLDEQDQMLRAGKFLWLDWAQARCLRRQSSLVEAEHDGYNRLGVRHRRCLEQIGPDSWRVVDTLLPLGNGRPPHWGCLHWLLPDWPWKLEETTLYLQGPPGTVQLKITVPDGISAKQVRMDLIRAGQRQTGSGPASPILGWFSPTYNTLQPALSLNVLFEGSLPFSISSEFALLSNPTSSL